MNAYFVDLTDQTFKNKEQFIGKKLFVANSLADSLDPDKEVHHAMLGFSKKVSSELGNKIDFKYKTYANHGHVPFPSFYDGLKYFLK